MSMTGKLEYVLLEITQRTDYGMYGERPNYDTILSEKGCDLVNAHHYARKWFKDYAFKTYKHVFTDEDMEKLIPVNNIKEYSYYNISNYKIYITKKTQNTNF